MEHATTKIQQICEKMAADGQELKTPLLKTLIEKLEEFSFIVNDKDKQGVCVQGVLQKENHSYEIMIISHSKSSAIMASFCVKTEDKLKAFALENVRRKLKKEFSLAYPSNVSEMVSDVRRRIELMDLTFERFRDFVLRNRLALVVLSEDRKVKSRYGEMRAKIMRNLRELIPPEIRFFPRDSYHFTHGRSNSFYKKNSNQGK